MKESVLEEIGLTKSEIHVYLALLELGSSSTGKIIEKSKVSSSKIYEILDRLIDKGLVSFIIKAGVKHFEAAPPERIMDYMKEKEENLLSQKEDLKKIIPELKLKQTLAKYKSEATIYKGMKGLETVFFGSLDLLKPGEELISMGVPKRSATINRVMQRHVKERVKRKIHIRIIFNEEARGDPQTNQTLGKVKFMPEVTPASISVYKNRVVIFPKSEEPLLIVIDNKEVADSFRVQFEKWWDQEIITYKGMKGLETAFYNSLELLKPGEEFLVFGVPSRSESGNRFFVKYAKERAKRKIKMRALFNEKARGELQTLPENLTPGDKIKYIPETTPAAINIFKDRVIIFPESKEPLLMVIDNKQIAESFKVQFERWWYQDTVVEKGMDAYDRVCKALVDEQKKGEEYIILGAAYNPKIESKLKPMFAKMHERRIKKGVKVRLLFYKGYEKSAEKLKKEFYEGKGGEYRLLPYSTKSPVETILYKDKTVLVIQEEIPTIIIITNKNITDSFKAQFELLWKQAK